MREGNVLYERESISNTRMWSTEECQHVAPYTWNGTRCSIRRLPTFWSISVAIDQQFCQDTEYTYLNSRASFPHNAFDRLIGKIGINTACPLRTLHSTSYSIMFNLHNKSVTIDILTICYRKFSLSYQQTAFQVAQHHLSQRPSSCQ